MKKEIRLTVRLPEEFLSELEKIKSDGPEKSISSVIRTIISERIDEHRKEDRLQMLEKRLSIKLDSIEQKIDDKW